MLVPQPQYLSKDSFPLRDLSDIVLPVLCLLVPTPHVGDMN